MAKYKPLTNEELATLVRWYEAGYYSQRELAEIFEVSRATVRRALKEFTQSGPFDEQVGQPSEPDMGQFDPEIWPTEDDVGYRNGPLPSIRDWLDIGAAVASLILAGWVGYIIYSVYN